MRTKTVIEGFKNSQKIRIIVNRVPVYTTVYNMAYNLFGDSQIRAAAWTATERLATQRRVARSEGKDVPVGLTYSYGSYNNMIDVQVDLL